MQCVEPARSWPWPVLATEPERQRFSHTLLQVLPTPLRLHSPQPRERIHQSRFPQIQPRITRRDTSAPPSPRLQTQGSDLLLIRSRTTTTRRRRDTGRSPSLRLQSQQLHDFESAVNRAAGRSSLRRRGRAPTLSLPRNGGCGGKPL